MAEEAVVYVFEILTTLTTKRYRICVKGKNALINGEYNWKHLDAIAAKRLGSALDRDIYPDRKNFTLRPAGSYISGGRRRKKPSGRDLPAQKPFRNKRKQSEESLTLDI